MNNAFVIGDRRLVAGFALAGVDGCVCATRDEVEAAIGSKAFVIFSAGAAELIADRIAEWQRNGSGPVFLVMP